MLEQVTFTVALNPDTVVAGATATLTVTPLSALPRLVTVSVSVSETGVLSGVFPSTLVFNTGETTGLTLSVGSLASVSTTSTVELRVSGDASTTVNGATQTLTVTPQAVTFNVSLSDTDVTAGDQSTLTVTSASGALPRDITLDVDVTDTGTALSGTFPTTITVANGAMAGTLVLDTLATLSAVATVDITLTTMYAFTKINTPTLMLTVTPQAVMLDVSLSAPSVVAGTPATLTVTSASGALPRDITLDVDVTATGTALSGTFPTTLTVANGAMAGTLSLNTLDTLSQTETVQITVSGGGAFTKINTPTLMLTVTPQMVTLEVSLSAPSVVAGTPATLTVTSTSGALPRDITLDVDVTATGTALSGTFPTTLTVANGAMAGTLSLNTLDTLSQTATVQITVSGGGAFTKINTPTQTLRVTPLPVLEQVTFTVTLDPAMVVAGETATLTITPLSALLRTATVSVAVSETGVLSSVFPRELVFSTGETTGVTLSVGSLASVSTTSTVELSVSSDRYATIVSATQMLTVTPQPVTVNVSLSDSGCNSRRPINADSKVNEWQCTP